MLLAACAASHPFLGANKAGWITRPPAYILACESDYSDPLARYVLACTVGPDSMRIRYPGSLLDRACHGEPAALRALYRRCAHVDGETAEVEQYNLTRVFFSLGDARFAETVWFAPAPARSFIATHLFKCFDVYHVPYPLTRTAIVRTPSPS